MASSHTIYSTRKLIPTESEAIQKIADWYFDEWETPREITVSLLSSLPNDKILFQLNIYDDDDKVVGTLGLYNDVNIQKAHPQFKGMRPWIGLFYVEPKLRGKGLGTRLMDLAEAHANDMGIKDIFIATFTAESMYIRCGYKEFARVDYKEHDTVVMKKRIVYEQS